MWKETQQTNDISSISNRKRRVLREDDVMMMESGERWDAVVSQIGTKGTLYRESEERLVKSVLAEQARI